MSRLRAVGRRAAAPAAIFVIAACIYAAMLGERATSPSPDNHFVHLAQSFLSGQLGVVGNAPPGTNDWACYDTVAHDMCPPGRFRFDDATRYRWYVSFPPAPAVVIAPAVAIWGQGVWDRLFWALLAGLSPALVYVLLRTLSERGKSDRNPWENLLLTGLFAVGTVFFFTAVQGAVWFAAHVVAVPLIVLYVLFSLDARRPAWAGAMLAIAFMTRPSTLFLAPFFLVEALRVSREVAANQGQSGSEEVATEDDERPPLARLASWLRATELRPLLLRLVLFGAPIVAMGLVAMWMNEARFDDPVEFGHRFLQIRWRPRIEKWGLFNYHYFGKNLAVFLAAMPWLSAAEPYVRISRHGLALWITTPNLLLAPFPRRRLSDGRSRRNAVTVAGLWLAVGVVAILNLCYQNSGWVQFGYRFSLDYLVLIFVLLAMGGRRFGVGFIALALVAVAINTFGAATFDRSPEFYDNDPTQDVIFQPD